MTSNFSWPWQYDFPPFFTIQKNADTKLKQMEAWSALILNYHKHHKILKIRVADSLSSQLFCNKAIDRKLNTDAVTALLNYLEAKGSIEWDDKQCTCCTVLWNNMDQWSDLVYKWALQSGSVNTVLTVHELIEGDGTTGEQFHGLDNWFMLKILETLSKKGKAEMIGEDGVKIFM